MIRLNWRLARKTFMANKQQIKHPPLTKGEILRINYIISQILKFIREKGLRASFDENTCLHFFERHPKKFDVDRGVEKIFNSNNTQKIKDLVCFIYGVFLEQGIYSADTYLTRINKALKNSPNYYFDDGKFILKRSAEIQEAIDRAETSRYKQARTHLKEAADLLYDDDKPNYGGSMMASIKALELVVREITGEKDIQKGIGSLENKGVKLHSQFQQAIMNLYRFTSADGVRHAHPNPMQNDEETALFMLVVCSAIINFIEARLPEQDSDENLRD